jgi:hypothetical protein
MAYLRGFIACWAARLRLSRGRPASAPAIIVAAAWNFRREGPAPAAEEEAAPKLTLLPVAPETLSLSLTGGGDLAWKGEEAFRGQEVQDSER